MVVKRGLELGYQELIGLLFLELWLTRYRLPLHGVKLGHSKQCV